MSLTRALRLGRRQPRRPRPSLVNALAQVDAATAVPTQPAARPAWVAPALVAGGIVVVAAGAWVGLTRYLPLDRVQQLVAVTRATWYAPPLYAVGSAVVPEFVLPHTIITIGAGFLFGAALGTPVALLSIVSGSAAAYAVGQVVARRLRSDTPPATRMARYLARLRANPFEASLLARILMVPEDVVGYLAGYYDIGWAPFLLGSVIGSLPHMIFFVQVGAGIANGVVGATTPFSAPLLILSGGLLAASLVAARQLRGRAQWGQALTGVNPEQAV